MATDDEVRLTRREVGEPKPAQQAEVGETRRERVPAVGETRRDAAAVGETRREPRAGEQRSYEVLETRREAAGSEPISAPNSLLALPSALRAEYSIVRELPNPGTEADVLEVVDRRGVHHVVKVYRQGIHAEANVWSVLSQLDSRHIVKISATGISDGRDYEVMEYVPGGNLTRLIAGGSPLPRLWSPRSSPRSPTGSSPCTRSRSSTGISSPRTC